MQHTKLILAQICQLPFLIEARLFYLLSNVHVLFLFVSLGPSTFGLWF